MNINFRLESYDYFLPRELIAQCPLEERDQSKLLVYDRKKDKIEHRIFAEITEYFSPGDCLVLNRTKVIPAKLKGEKDTGGKVEVLLVKKREENLWEALLNSFLSPGKKIFFRGRSDDSEPRRDVGASEKQVGVHLEAEVREKNDSFYLLQFNSDPYPLLWEIGEMPLPPYIKRQERGTRNELDKEWYQTVYAQEEGAIAAPTAGLHFTSELLTELDKIGVEIGYLLLHIGMATFKPVSAEDIRQHQMEKEHFFFPQETVEKINQTKKNGKRIIACGTTVVRVLESQIQNGKLSANEGETNFYIYPGYEFKTVDALITNFHLPKSTNLILVSAFVRREKVLQLYQGAMKKEYRFYSYGDAMLII